ncbi:MAG: phosphotransferase [Chloroflexota bacterium]
MPAAEHQGPSVQLTPLAGGGNNRVFRVDLASGEPYLLKWYFQDAWQERDRLTAEFSFLEFAWESGIRCVPRPVARHESEPIALYEFVAGDPVRPAEVGATDILGACRFVADLQVARGRLVATRLTSGAEACFSLAAHVECLARRVERLLRRHSDSQVDREMHDFVLDMLAPSADDVAESVRATVSLDAFVRELPLPQRCLSPSDFGFHNALRRPDGSLCFLDFEYAGWDDPARVICDFFCQVAVPVPREHLPLMAQKFEELWPEADILRRVNRLLPLYVLKWSCILLNEFLSEGQSRRQFALELDDLTARKRQQLAKARAMADSVSWLLAA